METNPFLAGLAAAQADKTFEIWPENWPAFELFCRVQTQWRYSGMGGPTGLDYGPLFTLMDRMGLSAEDDDDLFCDIQTLERAALEAMNAKD